MIHKVKASDGKSFFFINLMMALLERFFFSQQTNILELEIMKMKFWYFQRFGKSCLVSQLTGKVSNPKLQVSQGEEKTHEFLGRKFSLNHCEIFQINMGYDL